MSVSEVKHLHLKAARASIRRSLTQFARLGQILRPTPIELDRLAATLEKLDRALIRIAAFGLVSRGKSTVLNALIGQDILQTGPLHGVTQSPISIRWFPDKQSPFQIELIDTPGLDEVDGQTRAEMARDISRQADLILFVVAGDITRTEYRALVELRRSHKPLILVFNKIDLYPDRDRQAIYQQLQRVAAQVDADAADTLRLLPQDIVAIAAAPAPVRVRVEWADGRVTEEWETPPPQIDALKQKIFTLLQREGHTLIALNALVQAREATASIANKVMDARRLDADDLIWEFARYKAIAVAVNPFALVDVAGGVAADLALIRSLARLYNLPMTGYEASKLWRKILISGGGLLLSEWLSSALFGVGKTASAFTLAGFPAYAGAAIAQATFAGYGTYSIGHAAQIYLEQGCTWGPLGADTIVRDILSEVDPDTVLARLKQELSRNA